MTPKQEQRVQNKIKKIRKALSDDRQRWGGYHHDGQGLRYIPPQLFIKIEDYKGGLRYIRWFDRTFSGDTAYGEFLFECAVIFYKRGWNKEAKRKIYTLFTSNTFFLNHFLEKEVVNTDKMVINSYNSPGQVENLNYTREDDRFSDFVEWLERLTCSEEFQTFSNSYLELEQQFEKADDYESRSAIHAQQKKLKKTYLQQVDI